MRIHNYHILTLILLVIAIYSILNIVSNQENSVEEPGERLKFPLDQNLRLRNAELKFSENLTKYLQGLGFYDEYESIDVEKGLPDFTMITAFSENHVREGRYLVVNISQAFPERKIVVYGMGLNSRSEEWFKNACNVDYRRFDLTKYPEHVKPYNYRFKPLVVAEALQEFGAVMWTDTSSIWLGRNITEFLKQLNDLKPKKEDPQMYLFTLSGHNTYSATHPDMYKYLPVYNNQSLHERIMFEANKILIYRTPVTMKKALKWWVLCALEEGCLAPPKARAVCNGDDLWVGKYAECHRYDQSAVNLVLAPYEKSFLPQELIHGFVATSRETGVPENTVVVCEDSKK